MDADEDERTIFCGNLSDKVTEEILYELFLQTGPLTRVKIPKDREGRQSNYGFVTFKHPESVQYAIKLLNGIPLYDRKLCLKPRQVKAEHTAERNLMAAANQFIQYNAQFEGFQAFSPNRKNNQNYKYNEEGYQGGNAGSHMKHDRRVGNNKGYHNSNGRFNNMNKPYGHHKNDRSRHNRR